MRDAQLPVWTQPLTFDASVNQPFTASLSGDVVDPDGATLTITKKSGPAWLAVDSNGQMSGKPGNADLGTGTFVFTACNDVLCADGTVTIRVIPGMQTDTVQVDSAVAGAKAEYVWVVDNSNCFDDTIRKLKCDIQTFYDTLANAKVETSGVYLSSDVRKHGALPIKNGDSSLILSSSSNVSADFTARLDAAFGTGLHRSSPICPCTSSSLSRICRTFTTAASSRPGSRWT